jgi:diadenosine tetraphosphate (Ap4A) HIT family hydrolase
VPGGWIHEDALVVASHAYNPDRGEKPYLGHLIVETRRHASQFSDLTEEEAQAVGALVSRLARILRDAEGAEHVYVVFWGDGTPHFHIHLLPRYPGTPRDFWNPVRVDEAPNAKHGGFEDAAVVAGRVRERLTP